MALIAVASDKGAPGVTTAALALAAVWPRPVLLAECDPAGGDLVYRFPAVGRGHLDPRRGVLSLAVVARRGMQPQQVWEHVQKLHGGLDVLVGVTNAEQGAGLSLLWGPIGKVLASLPQADVIADCGRLGADGPLYDLLAEATTVVLVTKVHVADVIRLRDRAAASAAAAQSRGRRGFGVGVVVVADHKRFRASLGEVQHVLGQANAPATVLGGIAHDPKGADLLSGEWGGNLDRTMLIKTAREVVQHLVQGLPPIGNLAPPAARPSTSPPPVRSSTGPQPAVPSSTGSQPVFSPPTPTPDLVAATLPAPTTAAAAPRTTFSRVLGTRSGRHAQGPAQPAADSGSAFPRAPMPPLAPAPLDRPETPENPEDSGWGAAPWQHSPRPAGAPGPLGSLGSTPPGGG
jgi:MinD-like ATPase involved in chromosome partitioning or flagellar assembly